MAAVKLEQQRQITMHTLDQIRTLLAKIADGIAGAWERSDRADRDQRGQNPLRPDQRAARPPQIARDDDNRARPPSGSSPAVWPR
jgi:hypothetical protein